MKRILAFGEVLWDLLPEGPQLGGAPCNFAIRAAALGNEVHLVSRIGTDALGHQATEILKKTGLRLDHLQSDSTLPTGTVEVKLDHSGSPDFHIVPEVAYDRIHATPDVLALAAQCDCIVFGTLAQRAEPSRLALARLIQAAPKALKFLDLNLRKHCHTSETVRQSLEWADIVKLNDGEALFLSRELGLVAEPLEVLCCTLVGKFDLSALVVTLGAEGAMAFAADGAHVRVSGKKVQVVDTCGAGDAFSAGFLHSWLQGRSLQQCCELGNNLGAIVATQAGATQPIPEDLIEALVMATFRPQKPSQ